MEKVLTIEEAKIEFESHMLIALFKAAVEQSTLLTGKYKQKMKQDFNKWQKIGFMFIEELEKKNMIHGEYMNKLSDIYHNVNSGMRDEFYKGLES
jgi:hypothetical protein